MEKLSKLPTAKPTVNVAPDVRDEAQDAIAGLLRAIASSPNAAYYWYNVIGNNDGSLLRRMGIDPFIYGSLMLVAGLIEHRKVRGMERFTLVADGKEWNNFIGAQKLSDIVEYTKARPSRLRR